MKEKKSFFALQGKPLNVVHVISLLLENKKNIRNFFYWEIILTNDGRKKPLTEATNYLAGSSFSGRGILHP
jgi:hypothetical protein